MTSRQLLAAFLTAWRNFGAAKVRTLLTILGMVIGVAAVFLVMSVGESAQRLILSQIRSVGSNLIAVLPGASDEEGPPASVFGIVNTTFTNDDLEALEREVPRLAAVSGYVTGTDIAKSGGRSYPVTFQGVSAAWPEVEQAPLAAGRFFTEAEADSLAKVVVLGADRARDLYGDQDPVGRRLTLGPISVSVIGVLEKRGSVAFSSPDQNLYVPLRTAQKLILGIDYLNFARLKVESEEAIPAAVADVRRILRDRHDLEGDEEDDFSVRDTASALDLLTGITDAVKFFLVFVAGVSLFVGGLGIMNIMLIAARQRLREIGLRKALGARDRDIRLQFLAEAVGLSLAGGAVGILLGAALTYVAAVVIRALDYEWEFLLTFPAAFIAFAVSAAIGIVFGLYPAREASRVSPMEALRFE